MVTHGPIPGRRLWPSRRDRSGGNLPERGVQGPVRSERPQYAPFGGGGYCPVGSDRRDRLDVRGSAWQALLRIARELHPRWEPRLTGGRCSKATRGHVRLRRMEATMMGEAEMRLEPLLERFDLIFPRKIYRVIDLAAMFGRSRGP